MSELQLALLGAGAVAIALVLAYNLWQERKHRKAAEQLFKGDQQDVLLKDAPPLGDGGRNSGDQNDGRIANDGAYAEERVEPTFGALDEFDDASASPQKQYVATSSVDYDEPEVETQRVAAPNVSVTPQAPVDFEAGAPTPLSASNVPYASSSTSSIAQPLSAAGDDIFPADALADCVIRFSLNTPVPALNVWKAQQIWSKLITKPITWMGRVPGNLAWKLVDETSTGRYSDWLVAMQLADRNGPASDIELRQFFTGVDGLGQLLGIGIELPERVEEQLRAQSLDSFCAGVDVQFSIHLVEASGGTFAGTKLRGVCEAAGLALGADGSFHSMDEDGLEIFRISNIGPERFTPDTIRSLATQGVTLTIDVPRVPDGSAGFNRMITTAQQLARGLGGVLVDVQRAPLADAMISMIRAKIVELQQQMRAADILPGSPRALKLFS
jgi:FtsZ-interacting cell division protein ZipA